jgi:serine protease Do/serine protease DegQ
MYLTKEFWGLPLKVVFLLSLILALLAVQSAAQALPLGQSTLAPMLEKVIPGVVNISTRTHVQVRDNPLLSDPFFQYFFDLPEQARQRETQSLGSGVVVDARKGYVLTNRHVIDKADEITVTLHDGRTLDAEVVGSDPESDVAVIRIRVGGLIAVPLGNSDRLRVGDFVVAIGNPFGLGQTVTSGIVSALGRSGLGIEGYEDFIQTDASINPGNSGGALVSLDGKLIGLNTAIVGPNGGNVGIGFAIPVNMAHQIMEQLVKHGEVRRGHLGVHVQDLTADLANAMGLDTRSGALVAQIVQGSPAERAGLRTGDLVVGVNGRRIENATDMRNAIGLLRVDEKVKLEIIRDGRRKRITTRLRTSDSTPSSKLGGYLQGVTLSSIDSRHPLFGRIDGVMISEIEKGSPAAYAGLRPGDIITSINRRSVKRLDDISAAVGAAEDGLLLNIRRGNKAFFLLLR